MDSAISLACSSGTTATSLLGTSSLRVAGKTNSPLRWATSAAAFARCTRIRLPANRSDARRASMMNGCIGPKVKMRTASAILHLLSLRKLLRDEPLYEAKVTRSEATSCALGSQHPAVGKEPRFEERRYAEIGAF